MDNVAVGLEHVDLLDGLDGLSVKLLQGGEELLVVSTRAGRRTLSRSAGSTLSTVHKYQVSGRMVFSRSVSTSPTEELTYPALNR